MGGMNSEPEMSMKGIKGGVETGIEKDEKD